MTRLLWFTFTSMVWMAGVACGTPIPSTPQELAAAVDRAIKASDVDGLVALTHTEGLSLEDRQAAHAGLAGLIPAEGEATVSVDRLPDIVDISRPNVYNGRKIELSAKPLGVIRVASRQGRASVEATIPYVQAGGGYLLAGRRTTDLGWKGPPDRQLGFTFAEDFPRGDWKIVIKFNASGVELVETPKYYSGVLRGQHIVEFTLTGLPTDFKGRLVLTENGQEIHRSEPLTGRESYTYRREAGR